MNITVTIYNQQDPARICESPQIWNALWESKGKGEMPFAAGVGTTLPSWAETREIRVETTFKAGKELIDAVLRGVHSMLDAVGLVGFKFINYGRDDAAVAEVRQATLQNGRLDHEKLFNILRNEELRDPQKGGVPHADIVITDKLFDAHPGWWGASDFHYGALVLSVPEYRQNSLDFLFNVGKHEAGHLLGYGLHHCTVEVKRYPGVDDCVMSYECSTAYLCPKCYDALHSLWVGVGERTHLQYL